MPDVWVISDHHLNHAKILTFKSAQGLLIRPEFDTVSQMNECLLTLHNETVKDNDKVYFGGDVVWTSTSQWRNVIRSMRGRKYLSIGNHDEATKLSPLFHSIKLWHKPVDGYIVSHTPLREDDMKRCKGNIHGHLHEKHVQDENGLWDERYLNVCAEQIGYKPLHIDEALALLP